ncbi:MULTISPECIES: Hsp20 family protein [Halorussus]|uniref:Hsp20 family protein n=1 Tax=Halorussus TaxID=1070314 RepID=UPI000E21009A|nr:MULTISPECIES: Hsp20 family protein [Halorussus]NHN57873.1 Hsp20/alpha crystallin family protein [Halorussus sp. JP-T4]
MTLRDIGRSVGSAVLQRVGRAAGKVQESKPLPVDLLESDDAYLVVFDAPGATGSDVQVRYADGAVHVRIDRFRDFYEGFEMLFPGRGLSLDGRADLPADAVVDASAASATLTEHGTLRVRVPKQEQSTGDAPSESVEA